MTDSRPGAAGTDAATRTSEPTRKKKFHERNHPDWAVRGHRYHVKLHGVGSNFFRLPDAVRKEAFDLRDLWNTLVDAFDASQERYRRILSATDEVAAAEAEVRAYRIQALAARAALADARQRLRSKTHPDLASLTAAQREVTAALRVALATCTAARRTAREQVRAELIASREQLQDDTKAALAASPTYWANKEVVEASFRNGMGRVLKTGATFHKKKGLPTEIHFRHRFTAGGLPVQKLFTGGEKRVWLTPPPSAAERAARPTHRQQRMDRLVGQFFVAGEPLVFKVTLHRSLPPEALVKAVSLIGTQVVSRGGRIAQDGNYYPQDARFRWTLQFSLELPPQVDARTWTPPRETACAIDLGFRHRPGDQLRIGVGYDTAGQHQELVLPDQILPTHHHAKALQEEADHCLDRVKRLLQALPPRDVPEGLGPSLSHLGPMRASGLWKMLRLVEDIDGEPRRLLRDWANRHTRIWRERSGVTRHYIRTRNDYYRNIAHDLCRKYDTIVLEKLALKELAEKPDKTLSLELAAQYRFVASLSTLILYIKQAAAKQNRTVLELDPYMTTRISSASGRSLNGADLSKLMVTYPPDRLYDQDKNAAENLLILAGFAPPPADFTPDGFAYLFARPGGQSAEK